MQAWRTRVEVELNASPRYAVKRWFEKGLGKDRFRIDVKAGNGVAQPNAWR